jgi:hypothetical protein
VKKISENERALIKEIWKHAERLLDKKYFARASEYISSGTKDKDAFLALCSEAGIPERISGFDKDLHPYLWKCLTIVPPINMMW